MLLVGCRSQRSSEGDAAEVAPAVAVNNNLEADCKQIFTRTISSYSEWESVQLNGKMSMEGLPIRPTIRIYMKRDESIRLSLRAPFLGEVGRMELDKDSVLLVNKTNNKYCKESVAHLFANISLSISDIQNIFLARIFRLGGGELKRSDYKKFDWSADNTGYMLIDKTQPENFNYGFKLGHDAVLRQTVAATTDGGGVFSASYSYTDESVGLLLEITAGDATYPAQLTYDVPTWGADEMAAVRVSGKMKRVDIKEFLKF